METQFHVAVFCSEAAYDERRNFYSVIFGEPAFDGQINEGRQDQSYRGTSWDNGKLRFALLVNPDLIDPVEQLARVGLMFGGVAEFDSEVQRRGINKEQIHVYPEGQRQVFVSQPNSQVIEWEISCHAPSS